MNSMNKVSRRDEIGTYSVLEDHSIVSKQEMQLPIKTRRLPVGLN